MININEILANLQEYKINNILLLEQLQKVQNNVAKSQDKINENLEIRKEIEKNILLISDYNARNVEIIKKSLLENEILNRRITIYKDLLNEIVTNNIIHQKKINFFKSIKKLILRLFLILFVKNKYYKMMYNLLDEGKIDQFIQYKDSIFESKTDCAKFIINYAKQIHKSDREKVCKLAKLAWIIEPKKYILKWYGFRLIDIKEYEMAEAILEYVSEECELSKKEKVKFNNIKNINLKDKESSLNNNKVIYNLKYVQKLLKRIIEL